MTSANKFRLSLAEQTGLDVIASSGFESQLVTGEAFNPDPSYETSQRITGRRAHTDHILTAINPTGSFDLECAFNDLQKPLKGVIGQIRQYPYFEGGAVDSAAQSITTTGVTFEPGMICRSKGYGDAGNNQRFIAAAGSGAGVVIAPSGLVTDASPNATASVRAIGFEAADITATADGITSVSLDFEKMQLEAGQGVKFAGWAIAGMNARVEVEEIVDDSTLKLKNLPASWAAGAAKSGATVAVYTGDVGTYADDPVYFTAQKHYGNNAEGIIAENLVFDSLSFTMNAGAKLTASASVKATKGTIDTLIDATPTEVEASPVMSAARSIPRICEGGATLGKDYLPDQLSFTFANNFSDIGGLGYDGPIDFSPGDHEFRVQIRNRFGGFDKIRKVFEETETSLLIPFGRGGQEFILTVPVLTPTGGNANAGARNSEIMTPIDLMAKEDANGRLYTITILHETA